MMQRRRLKRRRKDLNKKQMPKQKDFFSKLKEQGRIQNPDFDKFLEALKDEDIPESVVKSIEDNFLTRERAMVDQNIHGKIKRDVLDPVDNDIMEFLDTVKDYSDPGLDQLIRNEPNTYNRLKSLKKLLPEVLKKAKGNPATDEDTKKKLKEYEKTIQEFGDKFTAAEKDYHKRAEELEKNWGSKFNDYKLNTELEKLTNKFTLAEAFEETRPYITEVTLTKLKNSNKLALGEKDGRPFIIVNDEEGKPKYNGNSPVTIDSLLDEAYKPFIKKSEGQQSRQENSKTTVKTDTQPKIRQGASTTVK